MYVEEFSSLEPGLRQVTTDQVLVLSPHARTISAGGRFFFYHSLLGNPARGRQANADLLERFRDPCSVSDVATQVGVPPSALAQILERYVQRRLLVLPGTDDRSMLAKWRSTLEARALSDHGATYGLSLMLTKSCNFKCHHCLSNAILESGVTPDKAALMPWATAQFAVDFVAASVRDRSRESLQVGFNGGEPLLNWPVMLRTMEYIEARYPQLHPTYTLNTNASLVTVDIAKALAQHRVRICSSLDGLPTGNDSNRTDRAGGPTHRKILDGWKLLAANGAPVKIVAAAVVDSTFDHINRSFLNLLAESGVTGLALEVDLVRPLTRPVRMVCEKLFQLLDDGRECGISVSGTFMKPFVNLMSKQEERRLASCRAMEGRGFVVWPSGDVSLCHFTNRTFSHMNEWEAKRRSDEYLTYLRSRWIGAIRRCEGCEIEGLCLGGCWVTTECDEATTQRKMAFVNGVDGDGPSAVEYWCQLYRLATRGLIERSLLTSETRPSSTGG